MQQTTFWAFLQKHNIEIPIIQRDYAQGRIGKEKLRETFLIDLKNALDGQFSKDETKLKLDFVYGSVENDSLNPLDGQQRLTTLWLLHWYIAFKAGTLSKNKAVFKKFSYETRISSREFCLKLSDFEVKQEGKIVSLIQNQTWFFSTWKQDPTIQAMFNMLGGTPIKDKDEEILDGIEEVFTDCDFSSYWETLISDKCPIIFYYLDLLDLTLSDDLYIKMNARGKSLTNFENFKADLVGFIKEKEWEVEWKKERINNRLENENIENEDEILKEENNPNKTFGHKLDTNWTNIFWKYNSKEHKIDDIYFAFMNRYFLNGLLIAKKTDETPLYSQKEIESNKLFVYLYGKKGDDSNLKYASFDVYKSEREVFDKKYYERFRITMDNFHCAFHNKPKEDINKLFLPSWELNSDFHFIPDYLQNPNRNTDNNEPNYISTSLTQAQRVVFFAICSYFENNNYDETLFKQWIRVVWNIVENANIETIPSMVGAIRLIDNLALHSNEIYEHLINRDVSKDFAVDQMEEEKEKAIWIIENKGWKDESGTTWEEKIIEAEKTAFFKGSIRFLFKTETNTIDWGKFDGRLHKSKQYFDEKGVKSEFRENARLICTLISLFTKWEQCWGEKKILIGNGTVVWNYIIKNDTLLKPLTDLLDLDAIPLEITNFSSRIERFDIGYEEMEKLVHEDMTNNGLISEAITIMGEGVLLNWRYNLYALYKPNANADWKKYVIGNMRNKIIFDLRKKGIVSSKQNISGNPYFWGWDINFELLAFNKKYQWRSSLKELSQNGEWNDIPNITLETLENHLSSVKE